MNSEIRECYKRGSYWNPAYMHYGNPSANVTCDRCRSCDLPVCIGYGQVDLCMQCVFEISRENTSSFPSTRMMPRMFRDEEPKSMMIQGLFSSTNMEQKMFNKK